MILRFSSFLATASLFVAVDARCSDGKIDGVAVGDDSVYDGFFYPGTADNQDDLQKQFIISLKKFKFQNGGVFKDGTTEAYSYQDDDGNDEGNTFTISAEYSGQEVQFKQLCEEIWACSEFYSQYIALTNNDLDYETRALCFDDDYYIDLLDANDDIRELRLRENYIVDTCWGGRRHSSSANSIDDLIAKRDGICGEAQALSERLNFRVDDIEDEDAKTACKRALTCIQESTMDVFDLLSTAGLIDLDALEDALDGGSVVDIFSGDGEVAYETCYGKTAAEIDATAEECEAESASGSCSDPPTYPVGKDPQCGASQDQGALPQCPADIFNMFEDFGPAYPDQEAGYVAAVATIQNTFIQCGNKDRTSADAVGIILFLKPIFDTIVIVLEGIKDSLPRAYLYNFITVPFVLAARIIVQAFDIVLDQADYHDALVQGAEIEALLENTRQMLNASAAIYDEVVCRCIDDLITRPQRGHGCDSIDNNCDDVVDDCAEDHWKPEISIGAALSQCSQWFLSSGDALDCVSSQASVLDDCDEKLTTPTLTLSGTCFASEFNIAASDRCGNTAIDRTVPVLIDESDPIVTCGFDDGSDAPVPLLAVYTSTGSSVLENVNFVYDAWDNCNGDLEVSVQVFSNEIEDFHSQELALLFQDGLPNDAAGLYIAKGICSTASNGQCIKDPNNEDIRIYTTVVSATDQSGRSASTECSVVVIPQQSTIDDYEPSASTQRFLLTTYSSTFEGTAS